MKLKREQLALPDRKDPKTVDEAKKQILALRKTFHEHAYRLGKLLLWVKEKVGHGNFLSGNEGHDRAAQLPPQRGEAGRDRWLASET